MAQFVGDKCKCETNARVAASDVFFAYKQWAEENGAGRTMSQKGLRDRLTRLGFGAERDSKTRYVTGDAFFDITLYSEKQFSNSPMCHISHFAFSRTRLNKSTYPSDAYILRGYEYDGCCFQKTCFF